MIARQKGQMVFIKHEFKPKPYWIVEWSMDPSITSGSDATNDTFWIIDAEGTSKIVEESELTTRPSSAVFGALT